MPNESKTLKSNSNCNRTSASNNSSGTVETANNEHGANDGDDSCTSSARTPTAAAKVIKLRKVVPRT